MGMERRNGESKNQISIMMFTEHVLALLKHFPQCSSRVLGFVVGNRHAMALRVKYYR